MFTILCVSNTQLRILTRALKLSVLIPHTHLQACLKVMNEIFFYCKAIYFTYIYDACQP